MARSVLTGRGVVEGRLCIGIPGAELAIGLKIDETFIARPQISPSRTLCSIYRYREYYVGSGVIRDPISYSRTLYIPYGVWGVRNLLARPADPPTREKPQEWRNNGGNSESPPHSYNISRAGGRVSQDA